jgi:hypothetical protein
VPITPDDIQAVQAEANQKDSIVGGAPAMTPPKRPKILRRDLASPGLILIFCFWLLGSWGVSLGLDSSLPAIRYMIFSAMLGMLLVWPMLRLSQEHPKVYVRKAGKPSIMGDLESGSPMTPGAVFSDWFSLNMLFLCVAWILRMSAGWSVSQTAWMSIAMASWSLIVGALLIFGCRVDDGRHRTRMMAACILLFLGEPLVLTAMNVFQSPGDAFRWRMVILPLEAIWVMSGPASGWETSVWAPRIKVVALMALGLWLVVLFTGRRREA